MLKNLYDMHYIPESTVFTHSYISTFYLGEGIWDAEYINSLSELIGLGRIVE